MEEILIVEHLKKTFKLSKKQKKLNKTNENYKIAVNDLSFKAYKGEIYVAISRSGNWIKVNYRDTYGYINKSHLKKL